MKLKKRLVLISLILFGGIATGQALDKLTLEGCLQRAHDNYPVIKQYDLVEKSRDLNVSNAAKAWLPGVNVTGFGLAYTDPLDFGDLNSSITNLGKMLGQATGQTFSTEKVCMENYVAGGAVTVNQTIYDGGAIAARKAVLKANADVEKNKLHVTMYDVNNRIEQLYFGILMLDEQIAQNKLLQSDLGISRKTVESLIKGGMANQSDLDAVDVRLVQAQQQEIGLKANRKTYLAMLTYFTGEKLSEGISLEKPKHIAPSLKGGQGESLRPELSLYAAQESALTAQKKSLDARLMPTLGAFGFATVHTKPMELTKPTTLGGGIMLKWNIGALYTRKNDLAKLETQRAQIAAQRETFLFNNTLQNNQTNGTIDNLRKQMTLDDKAINLRQSIRDKGEKKVKLGTETVNELLRDINAVSEAKQQKAIHEIQLLQAEYNLKLINNN